VRATRKSYCVNRLPEKLIRRAIYHSALDILCAGKSRRFGGFGSWGRNTFRGPWQKRFDISFEKTTQVSERFSLEFGFDIFNVFNTVNFANPNGDLQDAVDFGIITNTVGGPRVGQFRAKFRF
jgi:hypothetical protein